MIEHDKNQFPQGMRGVYSLTNTMAIDIVVVSDELLKYRDINGEWKEAEILYDAVEEYMEDPDCEQDFIQPGFYWGKTFIPLCEVIRVEG